MIVPFENEYTHEKWIVELTDWKMTNFSMGPKRLDGWYRQVLSVNGEKIQPEREGPWSIPRISIERAINDMLYARFTKVDPMISILFSHMQDRIYTFPNFYSQPGDWNSAKRKCDAILALVTKWKTLKVFI